jgi:uncharacterized protein (DUF885 family)
VAPALSSCSSANPIPIQPPSSRFGGLSDAVELADRYWSYFRGSAQLWNIDRGDVEQVEHWEDLSPGGVAARLEQMATFVDQARHLGDNELTERDRCLLEAVQFSAGATIATLPFERDLALVAGPFSLATFVSVLVPGYALVSPEHGQGYVDKLVSIGSFVEGWIVGLREGADAGRVATERGIATAIAAYDALSRSNPIDHPLASQEPPSEMSTREVTAWQSQVAAAIRDQVGPALTTLRTFLHDELLPLGRPDDRAGVCFMPDGDEAYTRLLWASTSTNLTPEAVHQLGLQQLARLDIEYRGLGASTLGVDDPVELREQLRTDPSLRYSTAEEIISDAIACLARAEAEVSRWFTRLPTSRCKAVAATSGAMAYYTGPSPDGNRPGTYFFNTADSAAWTRYQLEVTTFHEAVPGHHLQLALAQECDLHPVVGELEVTSYSEGWGLYAERMADDMGLYSSPLQRIGMLTLDSLRAARLVVDTGIHARGWTRREAIDFLLGSTPMDPHNAETEVDRYIAQPGQATSYMVGRLEIQRLREVARQRMGARFSIKDFHDVVLGNGMTPLHQLARNVDIWLDNLLPGRNHTTV